jgi:NAD(P)-dependent dehydrogenase (short-subunit alcohol dehydrogenase family)
MLAPRGFTLSGSRTGQPEDVVGPAIFLASDLAAYVTGTIIMADGGRAACAPPKAAQCRDCWRAPVR